MSRLSLRRLINKVVEITTMRKDSCRNCGITMQEFQRCTICSEINQFVCTHCRRPSDEQVHIECTPIAKEFLYN